MFLELDEVLPLEQQAEPKKVPVVSESDIEVYCTEEIQPEEQAVVDPIAEAKANGAIILKCEWDGSKLRVRPYDYSQGYLPHNNVRFPRERRIDGAVYGVEQLKLSSRGDHYLTRGRITRII